YALLNIRPTSKTTTAPAIAIINELKLKPLIPTPKSILPNQPPIMAPTIPRTIDPKIPPCDGFGSKKLAIDPEIIPNTIQAKIPIDSHLLIDSLRFRHKQAIKLMEELSKRF